MTGAHQAPASPMPLMRPGLQEQRMGEELLVYDPENRQAHVLNDTASTIFRMCDGRHSLEAMEEQIRSQYHVPEVQDVRKDIEATLALLREKKLLS